MDAEPPFLAENELEFVVGTGKGTSMNCPLIPRGSSRGYKAYSTRKGVTHWPVCPRQIPLRRALRGLAPRLKIAVLAPKSRIRPNDARNRCLTIS